MRPDNIAVSLVILTLLLLVSGHQQLQSQEVTSFPPNELLFVLPDSRPPATGVNNQPPERRSIGSIKSSIGLASRLKTLNAERALLGFRRRALLDVPKRDLQLRVSCVIGWSKEDTILLIPVSYEGEAKCYVINLSASGQRIWQPQFRLPRTSVAEITFTDETTRRPVLFHWTDEPRTMVDWAVRFDLSKKKVALLTKSELQALRKRVSCLLPPPDAEESGDQRERAPIGVVRGDGKILRKVLPSTPGIFDHFFLGRSVAEGHKPILYLFATRPSQINADPFEATTSNPGAFVRTGGLPGDCDDPEGTADFLTVSRDGRMWYTQSSPELRDACISVDGSSIAYVRNTRAERTITFISTVPSGMLAV